jgi:hypothetical protein
LYPCPSGPYSDGHRGHICDRALGPRGPGGAREGSARGPRKGHRKEAAQEMAVKGKVGAVCFLEKGRKYEEKKTKQRGPEGPWGPLGLLEPKKGPYLVPGGLR